MSEPSNHPGTACELLKLLRGTWLDRADIANEMGISRNRCDRWVAEFERHGLLVRRDGPRPFKGVAATEFSVAAEWVCLPQEGARLAPPQSGYSTAAASVRGATERTS